MQRKKYCKRCQWLQVDVDPLKITGTVSCKKYGVEAVFLNTKQLENLVCIETGIKKNEREKKKRR